MKLEASFELEANEGPEVGDLADENDLTLAELADLEGSEAL